MAAFLCLKVTQTYVNPEGNIEVLSLLGDQAKRLSIPAARSGDGDGNDTGR